MEVPGDLKRNPGRKAINYRKPIMISYYCYFVPITNLIPHYTKGFMSLLFYLIHFHSSPEKWVLLIPLYRGRRWREKLIMTSQLVYSKTEIQASVA